MAEYTFTDARFPDGTVIYATPLKFNDEPISGTVDGGSVTLTGLRELTQYVARGTVNGSLRESRFSSPADSAGVGASLSTENTFTERQTFTGDGTDTFGTITLVNKTTAKSASSGTAYYRPQILFRVNYPVGHAAKPAGGLSSRWQAPALDVTDGLASTSADLVLGYNVTQGQDIGYIADELNPRIGWLTNNPRAHMHVTRKANALTDAAVIFENGLAASAGTWLLRLEDAGGMRGGWYSDPAGSANGQKMMLRLGGTTVPTEAIDVTGKVATDHVVFKNNETTDLTGTRPAMFATASGGSYPFDATGHLVISPRASASTASGDILFRTIGTGQAMLNAFIIDGQLSKQPNAYFFGMVPGEVGSNAEGVLGFKNATTAPGSNPTGGAALWVASQIMRSRLAGGESFGWGGMRSGGEAGFGLGLNGTFDVKLWRKAANVLVSDSSIGTSRTTAPADADIAAGEVHLYFDSTNGAAKLKIKAKQADGTVKTGEVALA